MSLNFNPRTFDNKPQSFGLAKMFYDRSRYVALNTSRLVIGYTNRKFFGVFLPFGHGIGSVIHVYNLSTWLNNTLIYPRVYYINVDNTTRENNREEKGRGLKKDDSPLITGYKIFHNYVRPHMALDGKTPSEACGITIQGDDKWKTLIQRASLD